MRACLESVSVINVIESMYKCIVVYITAAIYKCKSTQRAIILL